jgi:hypothetical protein
MYIHILYDIAEEEPAKKRKTVHLSPILKKCYAIITSMRKHSMAWPFNEPVDPIKLNIPDYFDFIKHPMDFGTIAVCFIIISIDYCHGLHRKIFFIEKIGNRGVF